MKPIHKILVLFCAIVSLNNITAQSDGCSASPSLPVTATCGSPTSGTTAGATQTIPGCVGNADDDVWYQFTATATTHQVTVVGSASFDAVVQLFSGGCSVLNTISCMDQTFNGGTETIYATGLTIGAVYKIRVYHYGAGSGSATFTICVTTPPAAPANDNCSGSTLLAVNTACTYTNSTSASATQSMVGCAGNADDDVWFRFVATNAVQTITVDPSNSMDPVVQLFSGTCASLTSLYCVDNTFTNGNEVINAVGLTPGNTYYIRVYDYYTATGGAPFQICVTGTATAAPTNDEPCSAIALPAVTSECTFLNFTTAGATASMGAPTPASCAGGSSPFQGGFGASTADVWFSVVVPPSGIISITAQPSFGINDGVMALYSGTCGSLTQISCSDDYNYPGTTNDLKPYILQTGLTPGTTVFIRYWRYGSAAGQPFGICVSSPTNDDCANALYICDINGYSASTSAAYTTDRPCNMRANAEVAVTYSYTPGTCQPGGIFGLGGPWGVGAPACDVRLDNNSWIEFTAATSTVVLQVTVTSCFVGNYPSGGIQMQIFSGTNCCGFAPVSDFREGSGTFTITANGLTVGQDYYLLVDGYAGDICNYTINALSGVAFPEITASVNPICTGASTVLTAPAGATSYLWSPGGQTTQIITVSPSTTTTYSCVVEGVCGYKQTLTHTVNVNQLPNMTNSSAATICSGQTVNIPLTADLASTFVWVAANNPNTTGESLTNQTTSTINNTLVNSTGTAQIVNYTVTPTSTSGCAGLPRTVAVTVNPTNTIAAGTNQTLCINTPITTITLATTGATGANVTGLPAGVTGSWSGNVVTISGTPTASGTFSYNVATTGGCPPATTSGTITVTPNNTVASGINRTTCINTAITTITLATTGATGANVTGLPAGVTGSWSGNVVTISGTPTASGSFPYTVTLTGGCGNITTTGTITVNPQNTIAAGIDRTTCINTAITTISLATTGATGATITGLPAGVTGSWSGNVVTISGTPSVSGTFNYNVVTTGGCPPATTSGTITVTPNNTVATGVSQTTCINTAITTITLATTGATGANVTGLPAGVTGSWSGNVVTISGTPSVSGSFPYTVTLTGGCGNITTTGTITVTPNNTIAAGVNRTTCVNSAITTISLATTGATGANVTGLPTGVTGSWSGNVVTISGTPSVSGTFNYTVTLIGGCGTITTTGTITVNPILSSAFSYSNATFCQSGTNPSPTITGVTGGTFSGTAGLSINASTGLVNLSASTLTTHTVTYTTVGPCPTSSTFLLTITTAPTSGFSYAQSTYCQEGVNPPVVFTAGASGGVFSATPVGLSINSTTGLINLSTSLPNTYTVTNFIAASGGCAASTSTTTVTIFATPTVTAPANSSVCQGTSVTLTGSGNAISYSWNNGITNGVSFTPASTLTYTVTGLSANSCSSSASTTVTVVPNVLPIFSFGTAQSFCINATVPNLPTTSINGINGTWSPTSVSNTASGNYIFTPTAGVCALTTNYNVTINSLPQITSTPTFTPSGCTLSNGAINNVVISGAPVLSYNWTNSSSVTVGTSANLTNQPAGSYTLTVTDGNSCINQFGPYTITNPNAPTTPTPVVVNQSCTVSTGSISLSGGFASYELTGVNPVQPLISNSTGVFTNLIPGDYSVFVIDGNSCSSSPVSVTILNDDLLDCDGDGVTNGDEVADGTDPNDPCSFESGSITLPQSGDWLTADCDGDGVTNGTEVADGTSPYDPCSYLSSSVTLTPSGDWLTADCDGDGVTNGTETADGTNPFNPCEYEQGSITLPQGGDWLTADCDGDGVTNGTEVADGTDLFDPCSFESGSITLTPGGIWNDADCDGDGVTNGTEVADGTSPYDPCSYLSGSVTLTPSGDWLTADCDGDGVTNGTETTDGTNPFNPCEYEQGSITLPQGGDWLTADCDGDGVTNGTEVADGTDLFDPCSFESGSITLTPGGLWNDADCDGDGVTNGNETLDGTNPYDPCSLVASSITLPITTTVDCNVDISIPEGFSPNGDGVNDVFVIDNIDRYPNNHFTVLNRWGNIIYEKEGYLNTWDGTSQATVKIGGEDLPTGTYFYLLDLGETVEGVPRYYKGFIFLNR